VGLGGAPRRGSCWDVLASIWLVTPAANFHVKMPDVVRGRHVTGNAGDLEPRPARSSASNVRRGEGQSCRISERTKRTDNIEPCRVSLGNRSPTTAAPRSRAAGCDSRRAVTTNTSCQRLRNAIWMTMCDRNCRRSRPAAADLVYGTAARWSAR